MKKEKIRNIKVSKSIKKLIGAIALVDSLIIGIVSLGGHTPIYQDDKRINMIVESDEIDYGDHKDITVSNFYENEPIDKRNRVIYYQKPYENEYGRFRDIVTVYRGTAGFERNVQVVKVEKDDDQSYIETIEYNVDTDHYFITKETLNDELKSDAFLIMLLGMIDTGMVSVAMNYIRRKEEENMAQMK